jgi:Fic-DOC domain mobile mystery protein B
MAVKFDESPEATHLDPDEAQGLIPSHIATRGQLNEWEQQNILEGERWAFGRKHGDLLSLEFLKQLHRRMFGRTWKWAGQFRATEKNIGVDPTQIQVRVQELLRDVRAQIEHRAYPLDEIAARFYHRLVWIHPFPNGNGRVSRTMTDLMLKSYEAEPFSWGGENIDLVGTGEVRDRYIRALRAADEGDYRPLLVFVRSRS